MFILAGDIGYGNLKGAYGHSQNTIEKTIVRPSLVAPVDSIPDYTMKKNAFKNSVEVTVNKEVYVVGFEPGVLLNVVRELHHDYIMTDQYYTMFL